MYVVCSFELLSSCDLGMGVDGTEDLEQLLGCQGASPMGNWPG